LAPADGGPVRYSKFTDPSKRRIRYGVFAAVILLIVIGTILFLQGGQRAAISTAAVAVPTVPATADGRRAAALGRPPPAPIVPPAAPVDDEVAISSLRRDQAVNLIADARRQAAAGNFTEAEMSLQKAGRAAPHLPEIDQARGDIERLKTPEGSLAIQLQRARLAIDHDDGAAAEVALAEASRIKPDAPDIAELRKALEAARDKALRRDARIADALARMREATARRDFATADSALNEAERIDLQNPSVRRARGELARARGSQQAGSD
jgi:hypothetical protein